FGDVYGVDLNKDAISQCKKLGYKKLELKDITSLKYKNYFDVVIAIELIEHIKDDFSALQKINSYMKKDGLLVITAPAFNFLWSRDDELAHHARRYSRKRLRKLVSKSGVKIIHMGYRYVKLFFPALFVFSMQKLGRKRKNSLEYTPGFMNNLLLWYMRIENKLILKGFKFLFGVGLICIAKKR
ncbi:class I SAM-dependent methyltransferase, partial [Candidatus Woesearchaeota archaeon]|nr:class I SAM-dependent methyltransferase [Candidatus Woesearchaeota archaeon]